MEIKIERNELFNSISRVQSIIEKRSNMPILSTILLSAEDPYIHISAYYQSGMYWKYLRAFKKLVDPAGIMHPGRLALP